MDSHAQLDPLDLSDLSSALKQMYIKNELEEKGYCVVPNILSSSEIETALGYFHTWLDTNQDMKEKHKKVPHGIFRFHQAGHQRHAWYIRTRENTKPGINVMRGIFVHAKMFNMFSNLYRIQMNL